jgi:hypothetical protein
MNDIQATLDERGTRYGDFMGHAEITCELKGTIAQYAITRGKKLEVDQQEALDMICHKIGRILNGDPDYADSWHDIAALTVTLITLIPGMTLLATLNLLPIG